MKRLASILSCLLAATCASAHVSLDPPRVEAGATYRGMLRAGHGCDGAATTALDVQLPGGTTSSLRVNDKGEAPVQFQAPAQAGPLWLKVVQHCGSRSMNWAEVPAQGTSTEGMKTPAVLLQVLSHDEYAAAQAQPVVEGAWARASVPGQQTSGAFMRITAKEPTQLVAVSSPVAGESAVHEMKMEGDVMRMRPAGVIDLPVGRAFELKPGGYHVMLQQLKKPLEAGSTVPLTLVFRNAKGVESRMDLRVPVSVQAPMGMPMGEHKH